MATPRFWWYPDYDGSLEELDLVGQISDLQITPARARATALDGVGSPRFAVWGGGYRVRIVRERSLTAAVIRGLESLQTHLLRGGRVAFTADADKAWGAYYMGAGGYMERGRSLVYTPGSAFTAWSASAAVVNGDEVIIESRNPENLSELRTVSSVSSGGDVTLGEAMDFTREEGGLIRWFRFYPCLYLPDDQIGPIYTHEHGIAYTLDVTLQSDPAILSKPEEDDDKPNFADSTAPLQHDQLTMEGFLRSLHAPKTSGRRLVSPVRGGAWR